jgi:hypothetical protein
MKHTNFRNQRTLNHKKSNFFYATHQLTLPSKEIIAFSAQLECILEAIDLTIDFQKGGNYHNSTSQTILNYLFCL